jgi:tetratricopeptide (TPR) repeat protein
MLNAEAETYARYLQARTMLRGLSPDLIDPGIAILRQVLATTPRFAPAWAELGWGYGAKAYFSPPGPGKAAAIQEALAAANRALAIDPKLARAHLILGTNGASRPDARQHLETATRLDPGSAENWYFLHEAHFFEGDYPRTLDVLRRAVAIDPLWWPAFFQASNFAWEMGYREEAEAYVRRVEEAASPPSEAHMVRSDMANRRGDYSGAIAESEKAWLSAPPDRRFFAELSFGGALRSAGRYDEAARNWLRYPVDPVMLGMWKGKAPDPGTTRILIGDAATTWAIEDRIHFLLTTLQAAGRGADIARLFAARYPSPEAMARDMGPNTKFIERAVPVAFGLRAAGRAAEADRLLALASDAAAAIAARGPVPLEHLKVEAGLLATTGRRDEAIAALERAHARGFHYNRYYHSFPDMAQEPAFAPIRDDPRFQRIRRANLAHSAREAREIAAIAVDPRLAARFAARPTPN